MRKDRTERGLSAESGNSSVLGTHHSALLIKGGDDEETCRFDCGVNHLGHRIGGTGYLGVTRS
jgi:hypothetical protein